MPNRWLQDDDLPTWAHTTCVLSIVSLFALPLIWSGLKAIALQSLPPMMGPEFDVWMFGPRELQGGAAVLAGLSLMVFGAGCCLYPLGARPGHVAAAALAAVGLGRCALFLGAFTGQGMR